MDESTAAERSASSQPPEVATAVQLEILQRRVEALNDRVRALTAMLGSLLVPEGAGPGRFPGPVVPIGFRPPGGDEIHGPGSQNILVCSWDAVTVIVATLNWFGPDTPVAGKTVTFSFTNAGGLGTSVGISTGPGGTGSTSAPGGSVSVKTNAQGEAVIYVHSALKGTITLHASAGWSQGDDIVINFK